MRISSSNHWHNLYVPQEGKSSGVTELHKVLPAGKKLLLGDITGPGVIGHIYITHWNHSDGVDRFIARRPHPGCA